MTETTAPDTPRTLGTRVSDTIERLQRDLLTDRAHEGAKAAAARGALAELRRAVTQAPGESVPVWQYTLGVLTDAEGQDRRDLTEPLTSSELAVHHAVTLWALHQQSKTTPMHRRSDPKRQEHGLGSAVAALGRSEGVSPDAVERRFQALVTSDGVEELVYHLRSMVTQLRSARTRDGAGVALDYGRLAEEIRDWSDPARRTAIRLNWGRQQLRAQYLASKNSQTSQTSQNQEN